MASVGCHCSGKKTADGENGAAAAVTNGAAASAAPPAAAPTSDALAPASVSAEFLRYRTPLASRYASDEMAFNFRFQT